MIVIINLARDFPSTFVFRNPAFKTLKLKKACRLVRIKTAKKHFIVYNLP